LETNAALLLNGVTGIIKHYEAQWQKTGEKYNLFKVARINDDEVKICSVIADLLNPKGLHYKGDIYLKLFKESVLKNTEAEVYQELDTKQAVVGTEHFTDKGKRIDIVIISNIFIPIEAKINAGDLDNQISHYWDYSKTINGKDIPVLYLTKYGSKPGENSVTNIEKYKRISFSESILSWLEACLKCSETIKTPPVRENIIQLIATIKSFCGIMEDANMEKEIFELITKDDDSVRAALAISGAVGLFDQKVKEEFKGPITELVKKSFPDAVYTAAERWYMIQVPIKGGNYLLDVNYDWKSFHVEVCVDEKERNRQAEDHMAREMATLTNHPSEPAGEGVFALWETNRYPGLEAVDEALYFYRLCKIYFERPQEVADRIIGIARELESVKVQGENNGIHEYLKIVW
jgi:hypothetical protein